MEEQENRSSSVLKLFFTVNLSSCILWKDLDLPKEFAEMACKELVEINQHHILQINVYAKICLA